MQMERRSTASGFDTLVVNGYQIHNDTNPVMDAKKYANEHFKVNTVHILFGNGLGYYAEAFKSLMSTSKEYLIVLEPLELKERLEVPDVAYYYGTDVKDLDTLLRQTITKADNLRIVIAPNYEHIFADYYEEAVKIIRQFVEVKKSDISTIRSFSTEWMTNYISNMQYTADDAPIDHLYKRYNCPMVIASGGPSLTKQLPQLKKIRNHIILIAAGSTINTLLHHDIVPDYVVSIDGSEANFNHFKERYFENTTLLYNLVHHPHIRKQFKSGYYFKDIFLHEAEAHFQKYVQEPVSTIAGGASVATFALSIARFLSDGPVAVIGQDLAYTNMLSHAESNKGQYTITDEHKASRRMFTAEGYYGDEVLTDPPFFMMKESFEAIVPNFGVPIYNCTEGGIFIHHMTNIPFTEFLEKHIKTSPVQQALPDKKPTVVASYNLVTEAELKAHNLLLRLLSDNLILIRKNKYQIVLDNKTLRKLGKNEEKVHELLPKSPVSLVVNSINFDVETMFPKMPNETEVEFFTRENIANIVMLEKLIFATNKSKDAVKELSNQLTVKS
ncbi:motility associated factor glycosyltransferase family protein [Viridibacillus sp. YIM B01967]|uniref:Motility associated factor glycosyltransferase family protein n=1 Tax=Viridibacillus soli TaxID=2798301 RepID=A0ABS1H5B4_9BACL|nr:6-hydroxymethylpterin diphosphokinase MptE-like protein [Viridibacillus soli]MBK3494580.1 motility associated factor glycosyltransferase family protein [Viridibacillus soli]